MTAKDHAAFYANLPLRETSANRSRDIDVFNRFVGIPLASPYCASGLSYCFAMCHTVEDVKFPATGSSQALRKEFEKRKKTSWDPNAMMSWKGAIGGWTNSDGIHGHVFLVKNRLTTPDKKVVCIKTLEFNTDLEGDREGQGCFELVRRMVDATQRLWQVENADGELVGPKRRIWFCDTSDLPGGSWWL